MIWIVESGLESAVNGGEYTQSSLHEIWEGGIRFTEFTEHLIN